MGNLILKHKIDEGIAQGITSATKSAFSLSLSLSLYWLYGFLDYKHSLHHFTTATNTQAVNSTLGIRCQRQ